MFLAMRRRGELGARRRGPNRPAQAGAVEALTIRVGAHRVTSLRRSLVVPGVERLAAKREVWRAYLGRSQARTKALFRGLAFPSTNRRGRWEIGTSEGAQCDAIW